MSCTLKVFIPHHWTSLDIVDGEAAYAYSDMKLLQLLKLALYLRILLAEI